MKSPHLPDSPRRFDFRIRPFHVTLAVVIVVHVVAFYLFFRGGEPGGSSPASSADRSVQKASVTWQHIDSMVPDLESEVAAAASEAPEVAVPVLPDRVELPDVTAPAVAPITPPPLEGSAGGADGSHASETVPIRAATVVHDSAGVAPAAATSGQGRGFGEGVNAGFDFGAYDLLITREFHRAWVQPLGVDTPYRKNAAKLAVTIGRSGKVEKFSLARLTGVPELDSSVLAAARSVRRIAPLPESYHGDTYEVMINFQLD